MSSSEMSSPPPSPVPPPRNPPPRLPLPRNLPRLPLLPKKQTAAAAKKEEAKKAKEVAKEMEKAKKWRATQRVKSEKILEKKAPGVKAILDKLSTAWDVVGLAENQIRLIDNEEVSPPAQLDTKTKEYEEGPPMIKDFIGWIKAEYSPEEEKSETGIDGDKMEVDELESNRDAASEKVGEEVVNGEKQNGDNDEGGEGEDDDDDGQLLSIEFSLFISSILPVWSQSRPSVPMTCSAASPSPFFAFRAAAA
ncbi:hypothetical protein HD553DRAFT_342117 [Filobasidium floriforme]|uniref:uncharacterized protein n=1 Tax=Filobasidium floriforme TaxID=5210 RepID=UPI001E8CC09C|nr:uncharacterized protein HD553DRAFT_342117 [Filobasidium floriforme]KAH8084625.1 hypothetical protein HD553DRAFT_342117 [Filobasidium floriforme]